MVVSSHTLSEVEQTADHVLLITKGQLVRSSTLAALLLVAGGSDNTGGFASAGHVASSPGAHR